MKLLIFIALTFPFFANSFDYLIETHAKRKIVKSFELHNNQKFISFILDGTWSDNLGNYGFIEQASTVVLSNNNVVKLDGYGKTVYQNKFYSRFLTLTVTVRTPNIGHERGSLRLSHIH